MTFWDWWSDNRQKTWSSITAFFSVIGGLTSAGSFNGLLSDTVIGWLGISCALVTGFAGSATFKTALQNTTKERVAASEATVEVAKAHQAAAMKTAIESTPGPKP
jgi:hypothetical protein